MINHFLLVAAGGGIGAALRHGANLSFLRLMGPGYPWGTLFVNVVGSLIMGVFIGWLMKKTGTGNELRLFFATGLLGGFTTFSAFSLDVANLVERGDMGHAFGYVLASVLMAIIALFLGLVLARQVF